MLYTKFQGHWSVGSGKEDSLKVFTIYGHGGHIGHVTMTVCKYFHSLSPRRSSRNWLHLDQWLLRICLRLSYCESPRPKVKQ